MKVVCLGRATAMLCRLHSTRLSVGPPYSHTDTCVFVCMVSPNVGRMQHHVMNTQPLSLINKLGKARSVIHLWPIRPVIFPIIPEFGLNAVTILFGFSFFWMLIVIRPSAVLPVFLAVPYFLRLSREHWDTFADFDVSYSSYFCRKCRGIVSPLLFS